MKRFCLSVFAVASMLFAASCQQELNPVTDGDTTVTFTVSAGDVATRAIADGTNVDILHWEIYGTDIETAAQPLGEGRVEDADGNKEFTVELKLLADQEYNIVFWAEVKGAGHYDTSDLRNVKIVSYSDEKANDETRAAFFAVHNFETENGAAINETVYLYRPFAQINLGSTTYETSFNLSEPLKVASTSMTVNKIANVFNTLSGEGVADNFDGKVTFQAAATPNGDVDATEKKLVVNGETYYWLGMNYLIVNGNSDNVTVDVTLNTNHGEVKHTVSNVPVKENYRTNLLGNFLTTGATFNVVVDERFQAPDYIVPVPGEDGNGSSNTYTVSSAAELVWLQQQVNKEGNTFEGKTVKLTADIDLQGAEWTPIDGFKGTFDGSKGTKAADDNYTISNFTVNVNKCGGLFGSIVGSIKNVNIENATVVSNHFAGALVGYAYGRIENCHANNVTVTTVPELINGKYDNGDKAGAIVGYICGSPMSYLVNCSATNATVTAYRDLGAVAGCIAGTMTVEGNTAKDCKIVVDQIIDGEYAGSKTENANPVVGRNQSKNVTAAEFEEINKAAESVDNTVTTTPDEDTTLADLVATAGAVVEVPAGEYTFPAADAFKEGVTLKCAEGTVFEGSANLNINGATVEGATFSNPAGNAVGGTINGTFKDCVFDGSNGLRNCYAGETTVFENCVFTGDLYGVHFDGGEDKEIIFKDCIFSGFNAFAAKIKLVTFDGCTFKSNGRSGYNGANLWGSTKMINTEFTFDGSASNEWLDCIGSDKSYEFVGCTINGGSALNPDYIWSRTTGTKIVFDGVEYTYAEGDYYLSSTEAIVTNTKALAAALKTDISNINLISGEYEIDFYSIDSRDELKIKGSEGTKVAFNNLQVRASQFNTLTIENCEIMRMPNKSWGHLVFGASKNANGVYTISNCTFNGVGTQGIYINETVSGATYNINNCTFNGDFGGEGAVTIQNNDGVQHTVNVTGCTFNNIPDTSHKIYVLYAYDGWTLNAEGVDAYWKELQ